MSEPVWTRTAGTLCRRSLDTVLLLSPGAAEPVTLAGSGAVLWELLATPASTATLVAALAAHFDADEEVVEADVRPVLDELVALGALRPPSRSGGGHATARPQP